MKTFKHTIEQGNVLTYEYKYYKLVGIKNETANDIFEVLELTEIEDMEAEIEKADDNNLIIVECYSNKLDGEMFTFYTSDKRKITYNIGRNINEYFLSCLIEKIEYNNLKFWNDNTEETTTTEYRNETQTDEMNKSEVKELIQDLKNLDVILGKELSRFYYKYSLKRGELFVKMTALLEDIIKYETDNYTIETIYGMDNNYDIYELIQEIEQEDDILILNEFDSEARELLLKCESYLLKDNDEKKEYIPEPFLEHEYYKLLEVCFSADFIRIMDGLTLQKIKNLNDSKDNDILIEYVKKQDGEYFAVFKNEKNRIVCVGEHCQYCKTGLTDMDVHFLNGLQIKLLRANAVQDDNEKKLILMAGFGTWYNSSSAHMDVTKDRFIIEKNLNIEEAQKWDCLLSYFSDNIDINIIKNKEGLLELRIWKKGWKYQEKYLEAADSICNIENKMEQASRMCTTIAFYHCYTKAREALFNIVADVENCDIYGYMPKSHSYSNFRNFNNNTIIKVYNLQKIV